MASQRWRNVVLEWWSALVMPSGWLSCHGSAVQGLYLGWLREVQPKCVVVRQC